MLFPDVWLQAPSWGLFVELAWSWAMLLLGPCGHVVNTSPGWHEKERDSLLEAMGHAATMAAWPMEKTGECTV